MNSNTILLIEDSEDDVDLMIRAIRKNGISNKLIVKNDGQTALDHLLGTGGCDKLDVLPTVILLDLKLPRVDGLEVLKKIRANEHTKHLPVVILTSSKDENDVIKGYDNGCNSYVQKPIDFEEFVEAVRQIGLYWLIINEVPIR